MRIFSARLQQLLAAGQIRTTLFARLDLVSGNYGASDADDTFDWDNGSGIGPVQFGGFGQAFRITAAPSTTASSGATTGGALVLSGTDSRLLNTFREETYRGRLCDIGEIYFDLQTGLPVEERIASRLIMDYAAIEEGAANPADPTALVVSTLTVSLPPRTLDLTRKGTRVRSDRDQRLRDVSDPFFQDVGLVAETQINWDRAGPASPRAIVGAGATQASAIGAAAGLGGISNGGGLEAV